MSETDFTVDSALPLITAVSAHEGFAVTVTWSDGKAEVVDLAPAVFRYKIYAPLRADERLFASIHVADGGFAVAWGDDEIDMASTTIEDLAGQAMTAADFSAFMKRHRYTLDGVAAELGISRRLAAYYQKGRQIPRYVALACAHLDTRANVPEDAKLAPSQERASDVFRVASEVAASAADLTGPTMQDLKGTYFIARTNAAAYTSCLGSVFELASVSEPKPARLPLLVSPVFHRRGETKPKW